MKKITQITIFKFMTCLLVAFQAAFVSGAVLYVATDGAHVPPYNSWANAATNIQTALDAAGDGDIVLVGTGRFVLSQTLTITKGITLLSRYGSAVTEINGNNSTRCFTISHPGAVLEGFTITAGSSESGGGIYITNGLAHNCVVIGNYAQLFGGGVYIGNAGTVSSCVISSNRAPVNAGGCGGGACIIGNGLGGGRLTFSTLSGNEAASGGGVYMFEEATVANCIIVSNRSWDTLGGTGSGGGVECNGRDITVKNCHIAQNRSQETAGGVYLSGHAGQKVLGCLIYDNETAKYGGGLYVNLAPDAYSIESCTVVGNRSTNSVVGFGGGICSGSGQAVSFRNSIVYLNIAAAAGNNYHVVDGGAVASGQNNCTTPALAGTGNTASDPLFYSAAGANFRLAANSPCVDTGLNQDWMAGAMDIDGNARIINSVVDMGAYERNPNGGSEPAHNDIVLRVISPSDGESFTAPAAVYCDMRAEQEWWGGGITQTVALLDSVESNRQSWNNERYCMIQFTIANVTAGSHMLRLYAWDAQGAMVSTAIFFSVAAEPVSQYCFLAEDCDGDRLADTVYYNESNGFYCNFSSIQYPGYTFGPMAFYRTDFLPLAGDFDGDGLIDLALYNDAGGWRFSLSSRGYADEGGETLNSGDFKLPDTGAVTADFDGDARADLALYSAGGGWCFKLSTHGFVGQVGAETFNASDFKLPVTTPVAADFDGDRRADLALYHQTDGWYFKLSSYLYQGIIGPVNFIAGGSGAFDPAAGDFDLDGKADPAVVSQSGAWYVWLSSANYTRFGPFNFPPP
jgi:hypothetical protein